MTVLIALLVCLIPTTIGGLLSAIGIAGMDRLIRFNVIATSGRAVEAAGDVDTLLLDKTGTITFGNRMADEFIPVAGVGERAARRGGAAGEPRRRDAGGPLDRRAGQDPLRARGAGRPARTRRSCRSPRRRACPASTCRGRVLRKGAVDAILARGPASPRDKRAGRFQPDGRSHLALRRHAARGLRQRPAARRRPPQGHRQARHPAALRRTARDGHQDGDGDRRQSAHRRGDRFGSGRRRLPRPGDAGGQARLYPQGAAGRPADRHVRRRHQRRAGARAGRRRRRDADRHPGGARSRQHGRSRFRPDQADRDRRHRQAIADDARLADDLLDRQRRRQIFRHHSRRCS